MLAENHVIEAVVLSDHLSHKVLNIVLRMEEEVRVVTTTNIELLDWIYIVERVVRVIIRPYIVVVLTGIQWCE